MVHPASWILVCPFSNGTQSFHYRVWNNEKSLHLLNMHTNRAGPIYELLYYAVQACRRNFVGRTIRIVENGFGKYKQTSSDCLMHRIEMLTLFATGTIFCSTLRVSTNTHILVLLVLNSLPDYAHEPGKLLPGTVAFLRLFPLKKTYTPSLFFFFFWMVWQRQKKIREVQEKKQ